MGVKSKKRIDQVRGTMFRLIKDNKLALLRFYAFSIFINLIFISFFLKFKKSAEFVLFCPVENKSPKEIRLCQARNYCAT